MRRDVPQYIKDIASKLRKNQTEAEELLWDKLRRKGLNGYRFRRQYPIGRYIADFYCPEANLVIEVDGDIHNSEEQKEYDKIKEQEIDSINIKVIRFKNIDILERIDLILNEIKKNLILT